MTSDYCFFRKGVLLFCLFLLSFNLKAQNFVLNGSFEDLTKIPMDLGDFYPEEWYKIRGGSPDIYSVRAPSNTAAYPNWKYCQVKPFEGLSFAGLILEDKKEDYKEPIGTELITDLREDSTYLLRISVAIPAISLYRIASLDLVLSRYAFSDENKEVKLEDFPTRFSIPLDSVKDDFSWQTFSFEFQAKGGERYLSIGNFKPRKASKLFELPDRTDVYYKTVYTQAYVCVDQVELFDVALMKEEQSEKPQVKAPDPELFHPITLKNLLFEVGSSVLQNKEIPELDKLVAVLKSHESVTIRISGHTDNSGDPEENNLLSQERAESVATYLMGKGIDGSRITTEGFGAEVPVASNETEEGKAQNRRVVVEFEE